MLEYQKFISTDAFESSYCKVQFPMLINANDFLEGLWRERFVNWPFTAHTPKVISRKGDVYFPARTFPASKVLPIQKYIIGLAPKHR